MSSPTPTQWTLEKRLPGRALGLVLLGGIPIGLMPVAFGPSSLAGSALVSVLIFDLLCWLVAGMDARFALTLTPEVSRITPQRFVIGVPSTIRIVVQNRTPRRVRISIREHIPASFDITQTELACEVSPNSRKEVTYTVVPRERGAHELGDTTTLVEGPLRLLRVVLRHCTSQTVHVYPNVGGTSAGNLRAREKQLALGLRSIRVSGGRGEFASMREYVPGDPFRFIDWKSTAKRQRPITRAFEHERSQLVVIGVDAGHAMSPYVNDKTKLDHALESALVLAYTAIRLGDRVSFLAFDENVHTYVKPGRSVAHYSRILEASHRIQPYKTYSDYNAVFDFLELHVNRRALVVLVSDLLDETNAAPLLDRAAMIRRRHLPLFLTHDDSSTERASVRAVASPQAAYTRAAAIDLSDERDRLKLRFSRAGIHLVEAPAGQLGARAVDRYLEFKSKAMI